MPYTKTHKARTRERIVESARRLFNLHGFAGVSIDDIMAAAGLTRGGFYNHFGTKEELFAEVVTRALACGNSQSAMSEQMRYANAAQAFIAAYLSQQHLEAREMSCPLVALPSDVARGGEPVKRAYRQMLEYMIANLEQGMSGAAARNRAMAVAALCIGGMAVARALDDATLAHEVREAAMDLAISVVGHPLPRIEAAE